MALKFGNLTLERLKLSNLYSAYFGMTPREQTIALIAATAIIILIIVMPVVVASGRIAKLEKDVTDGKKQLKDIMRTLESYEQQKASLQQTQQTLSAGFDASLSSTIESLAEAGGIKDKIDTLKDKPASQSDIFDEDSVDVKLKKITLDQLTKFLFAIEHHPEKVLRLKGLSVKTRFDNKSEMDATFTVSTFKLLEGAGEGT